MKKVISLVTVVMIVCICLGCSDRLVSANAPPIRNPVSLNGLTEARDCVSNTTQVEEKCGTMTILETKERQENSGFGIKSKSSSLRPTDLGGGATDGNQHKLPQLYNTTNFVLHWTNGNDGGSFIWDAVSLNDSNANGIPDYVENMAEIFENVRNFTVTTLGFHAPPSDAAEPNDLNNRNPDGRYDVFIYIFGYLGYAQQEQYSTSSSYSHIGMRSNYTGFAFPWETDLGVMQTTAAHEFFHAIQFYYDCNEERWWMETTATYMEDEVYPDVNNNYGRLPYWFQNCDINGLESTAEEHEYGNFIFAKRLSEDFEDGITKEIWEEMASTNGLIAINNTLVSRNSTLKTEFSKFITANFFLEEMYVDGTDYRWILKQSEWTTFKGVWLKYQYNASTAADYTGINGSNTNRGAWMDRWGTSYVTMKLDPTRPNYTIMFDGLDLNTDYLVKMVTKKNGIINETLFSINSTKDGYMNLAYDDFDNITLIIANAGNAASLIPSWRVTITMPPKPPLPIYDVAIIDLKSSTDYAHPGETINISITVKNNGTQRNENFNISTYWGQFQIETEQVTELAPATTKTLNITWTIPSDLNGSEIIWANATLLSDDANPENNRLEIGMLKIVEAVHDVAIKTANFPKNIICQGRSGNITVIAKNNGTFPETINITAYLNGTAVGAYMTIILPEMEKEVDLNVTAFPEISLYRNYTIRVEISPVPGEENLGDNVFLGSWVIVTIEGDVVGREGFPDGKCDLRDVGNIARLFGISYPDPQYNANLDLSYDKKIDMKDVAIAARNFGKTYS